jgi:small subunit ribosomal protein S17e
MGRIKTAPIKRISIQLMRYHKEKFSSDFEENKKVTNELVDLESKKLRNIIAGYLTRMVKEGQEITGGK